MPHVHSTETAATAQVLASLERWAEEAPREHAVSSDVATLMWDRTVAAGTPGQYAAERAMLTLSRWAELTTVEERARYISSALGHHKQSRVTPKMAKLCPKGGGQIEVLNDVQSVAPLLLTPGGPIRRLILQIPPGAGKTCTYIAVISQFLGNGHSIVVVGDDDVFAVFKEGLRQCPAQVLRRMVDANGNQVLPETVVYLRDINPNMSAFCTLKCPSAKAELQGDPYKCDAGALTWLDTKVYFFNFVMAGNWMRAWSEERTNKKGNRVSSMYLAVNPFSDKLLLVVDEAHKTAVPSMEQATARWKKAAALFPKYIAGLGQDPSKNPYILFGSATMNVTTFPTLSLCLPVLIKGKTDSGLHIDCDFRKPPRINLHKFLSPDEGFVRIATEFKVVAYPTAESSDAKDKILMVDQVRMRLFNFRGFALDEEQKGASEQDDLENPCPVSVRALREAGSNIYIPIDNEKNRKSILDIWAGVAYIVDMSQDYRYYPVPDEPYPFIRAVSLPNDVPGFTRDDYLRLLETSSSTSLARWSEVSQFADTQVLKELVQSCLQGDDLDLTRVETLAPKWKAVADDLLSDQRLKGRTMIYPGAFYRNDCDDNYYLLLLAYYLQARLRHCVEEHFHPAKQHQLVTVDSVLHTGYVARTAAPAIYIVGDSAEGKYKKAALAKALKTGQRAIDAGGVPAVGDFLMMMSTKQFRERQYNRYNEEICPGPGDLQHAAGNTIIILAEGGHKALDLKCTTNGLILTTMPGGKFQQTQGRVKRSCAFKALMDPKATSFWRAHVRIYLTWAPKCVDEGPVLDQVLHSFYHSQYQIIRYLEMLQAMAGIGCSKWEIYSNWKQTFSDFDDLPEGGFRCVHDADLAALNEANDLLRDFYCCGSTVGRVREAGEAAIGRGISGDVSVAMVQKSAEGACRDAPHRDIERLEPSIAIQRASVLLGGSDSRTRQPFQSVKFAVPAFEDAEDLPKAELPAASEGKSSGARDSLALFHKMLLGGHSEHSLQPLLGPRSGQSLQKRPRPHSEHSRAVGGKSGGMAHLREHVALAEAREAASWQSLIATR